MHVMDYTLRGRIAKLTKDQHRPPLPESPSRRAYRDDGVDETMPATPLTK